MAPAPKDYTAMTKRELVYSFSIVTVLFFIWVSELQYAGVAGLRAYT
jgi:hypothetical protein